MDKTRDPYRASRVFLAFEATLEYMIVLLVSNNFLAALVREVGLSEELAGILTAVTALGCVGQLMILFSPALGRKRRLLVCTAVGQPAFCALYFLLLPGVAQVVRIGLFVGLVLIGNLVLNFGSPGKVIWGLRLAGDGHRGGFTAFKECISLFSGSAFTVVMGLVADSFRTAGRVRESFLVFGISMVVIAILQFFCLVLTKEVKAKTAEGDASALRKNRGLHDAFSALGSTTARRLILIEILFKSAYWLSLSYYGIYMLNLGFSLGTLSIITTVGAVARFCLQPLIGRMGDRRGFEKQVELCVLLTLIGHAFMIFAFPGPTAWFYVVYAVLTSVAMSGMNSSGANLAMDYASPEVATPLIGIGGAAGGICAFLSTLFGSLVIGAATAGGNSLFGLTVYGQQILSLISCLLLLVLLVYLRLRVRPMERYRPGKSG